MYINQPGLAQPQGPQPQPVLPGTPPVPMPNPAVQPTPIVSGPQTLFVRSTVQCSAAQRTTIQNIVGPGTVMNDAAIRGAIQAAHDNIFPDLTDDTMPPVQALLSSPRTPLTVERFKIAFGKSPNDLPWRGARWDLGRIVATRLQGARKSMFSSSVRISCFGWPWPGGGVDQPMLYMVKTLPKRERVALGALFWQRFAANDQVSQSASIVIAGLVMRYGVSYRMLAPPLRNIHCYVKYGLLMLQHPIPSWVEAKCATATVV